MGGRAGVPGSPVKESGVPGGEAHCSIGPEAKRRGGQPERRLTRPQWAAPGVLEASVKEAQLPGSESHQTFDAEEGPDQSLTVPEASFQQRVEDELEEYRTELANWGVITVA